ncbi:hypothetical protein ACA910_001902 [Epithemia clementina (nom. ined.)]
MLSKMKCLVTGASSGIGKATCQILTQYGAKVVGSGRNQAALAALKQEGWILDFVVADVSQEGECTRLVQTAAAQLLSSSMGSNGGDDDDDDDNNNASLDAVVIAHGALHLGAMGDDNQGTTNLENYKANMTVNAQAPFEIIQAAVPFLKKKKNEKNKTTVDETTTTSSSSSSCSSIVIVSSVNGKQSFAGCATYCMSKAAVDQLTRCASIDLAKYGIRVNAVNPGVVETNLHKTSGMSDDAYQSFLQRSVQVTHPLASSLNRVGQPQEVAELIAFLVSDKAQFLTGECIAIDGGRQNLGAR